MEKEEIENAAFEIILHSGSSRNMIHESFELMRKNKFKDASNKVDEANDELLLAHQSQTSILQRNSSGEKVNMEMIMVHAQDHLMSTMTLKEMALEMLHLYEKLEEKVE